MPDHLQPYLYFEGQQYILRNFSESGMGVWVPEPVPFGLKKGTEISGDIVIGNQIHPVRLEVMHQAKGVLGLRIVHKSVELGEVFRKLLEPTVYAQEMQSHPKSGTVDKSIGYPRLWYSGRGTELLVWYNPKDRLTLGIQLRWLGQWVFRERLHAPQTGYLVGFEISETGRRIKNDELLIAHSPADAELLLRASQFLAALPESMSGYLLWQFLESGKPMELPLSSLVKKAS